MKIIYEHLLYIFCFQYNKTTLRIFLIKKTVFNLFFQKGLGKCNKLL